MKLRCLFDNIVVVRGKSKAEKNGILLPDSAVEESNRGEVKAVGPDVGCIDVGDEILMPVSTMMRVAHNRAFDLEWDGEPAVVLKEEDVQVVWEKEK